MDKTKCDNISIELDNYKKVVFPVSLYDNQIIRYEGGNVAIVYDKNWNKIKSAAVEIEKMEIGKGEHSFEVDCDFLNAEKSEIKIEIKTKGEAIKLKI